MATRLSVRSNFGHEAQDVELGGSANLKRNAWLALFGSSVLFWVLVAAAVWNLWQ